MIYDLIDRSQFSLASRIHNDHPLGHFGHRAHVMGDQNNGCPGLFTQVTQKIKNLCLNGDIQRRRGFIRNQNFWCAGQSHCDHRPLPLSTGHLKRVIAGAALGVGNAHRVQKRDGLRPGSFAR